jgi:PAS domain S-box-containing protein
MASRSYSKKLLKALIVFIGLLLTVLLAALNNYISIHLSLVIFYLIPIYLVVWYSGPLAGAFIALCSIVSWFFTDIVAVKDLYFRPFFFSFNMIARACFLFIIVYLLTKLKSTLAKLQKSEAWLSVTLKSIGDAVIATDIKGNITFINLVASVLTRWEEKEAIGKQLEEVFNIINEKTGERAKNPVTRAIQEGVIVGLANHTALICKNGEKRPIDDSAAPIKDEKGELIGVILIFRDVTEQRQAQLALEASEESHRSIFESVNDAIIIRDINTYRIVNVNKKACEMFCYPKEEMISLEFGSIGVDSAQYPVGKLKELLDKAANNEPQLFEWPSKDRFGREFWIEMNIKRAIIEGQYRLLCVARDVTERRQLLEQKDNFMNMVSHELRTPLGAIKESVSLTAEGKIGVLNEKQKEMIDIAKRNADRLARLVGEVLDLQKIDTGKMEFKLEENDMNKTIEEVHKAMISLVEKKGLSFILKLDDKLPRVKFDRDKILEVLINLVNNAIKFTEKGDITIASTQGNNFIRISVKDTGPGIRAEDLPKLFQRFSQLERKPGGTGLGLAISKEIMKMHKGKIEAESEFGKGATFYFILPINERRV